jgi:hypothetical protein
MRNTSARRWRRGVVGKSGRVALPRASEVLPATGECEKADQGDAALMGRQRFRSGRPSRAELKRLPRQIGHPLRAKPDLSDLERAAAYLDPRQRQLPLRGAPIATKAPLPLQLPSKARR